MAKQYDTGGIFGPGGFDPFNSENLGKGSPFSDSLNFGFNTFFGENVFSNFFAELSGYSSQQREFEQQEYLMDKENEYNTPAAQMARLKAAGINPQLAAAGIAGAPNVSASPAQVASNAAGAAQGLNAAMNAVGAGVDAVYKLTSAKKMEHEIDQIDADTEKSLTELGFTKLQSRALGIQLKYMDYKERMSCYQVLANFATTKAQYHNILAEHNKIIEECNTLIAQQGLMASEQAVNEAQAKKIDEETRWQKLQNDFFVDNGYIAGSPMFEALRDAIVNGKSIDIDGIGDLVAGYEGKVQFVKSNAEQQAVENHAYNIAYESGRAAYDFDWNSPSKSLPEFLDKKVGQIHSMVNGFCKNFVIGLKNGFSDGKSEKQILRDSFVNYKQQLDTQYTMINLGIADCYDDKGNLVDKDTYYKLLQQKSELSKMPQSYIDTAATAD